MQSPPSKDSQGPSLRPGLFRFALNGLVVSLLFLAFSRWGLVWLERFLPESDALALVAWGVTVAIAAPFVWGMFFAFQSNSQWEPRVLAVPAFFAHLGTVFWFGFLSSTFFATTLEFVLTLSLALGLFLLFYQRLERAYRGLERHLLGNIGPPEPLGPDPLNTLAPWDLHLVRVALNPNSPLCGQTLAESAIRQRFGVNVVAIQRAESCVTAPRASHLLFPHDELLILGTDAQLDAFRPVALGENAPTPAQAPDFSLQQVLVQQDSDLAGKTIRDSGIRQSLKGLIVGLENGPFRTTNPDPQRILTPGDILWVVREAV